MNYTIREVPATNSLGMPIRMFEILKDGSMIAETRTRENAEKIMVALMQFRDAEVSA